MRRLLAGYIVGITTILALFPLKVSPRRRLTRATFLAPITLDWKEIKTMAERYDLAVIGAGMGGVNAASRATRMGARVAVIERHKVGGT